MKKTLTLLACLVMAMSISARSYVAVADTGYVAPGDTAHTLTQFHPGSSEPRVEIDDAYKLVQREFT